MPENSSFIVGVYQLLLRSTAPFEDGEIDLKQKHRQIRATQDNAETLLFLDFLLYDPQDMIIAPFGML